MLNISSVGFFFFFSWFCGTRLIKPHSPLYNLFILLYRAKAPMNMRAVFHKRDMSPSCPCSYLPCTRLNFHRRNYVTWPRSLMVSFGHVISFPPVHIPDKTPRYVRAAFKMSFPSALGFLYLSDYSVIDTASYKKLNFTPVGRL